MTSGKRAIITLPRSIEVPFTTMAGDTCPVVIGCINVSEELTIVALAMIARGAMESLA